jgi:phosphoribosylformimino-5-aminoimidazole carboxamide ribotide isomerase
MVILPAIDLRDGKVVRLLKGDYNKMTVYGDDPLAVARSFKAAGAEWLHTVDLDGAKDGDTPNFKIISEITLNSGLKVEVGGGIRSMKTVKNYISAGVSRVIIGTAAVTNPDFLADAVSEYGDKVAVGIDVLNEHVAIHGWTETTSETMLDFCLKMENIGVQTVICTDISKDGAMQGANHDMYRILSDKTRMNIIASGGVSSLEDVSILAKTGVWGAILGKAIYTGAVSVGDAIAAAE